MKTIGKLILLSAVASSSLMAGGLYVNTAAQYKTTSYDTNSGIEDSSTMGLYVSKTLKKQNIKIEGAISQTTFNLVGGEEVSVTDVTAIAKMKAGKNIIGKAGIHYTTGEGEDSYTVIAGAKIKHSKKLYSDTNVYYTDTDYNQILQINPKVGMVVMDKSSKYGYLALEADVNYINNGNSMMSYGVNAKHKIGNFTNEAGFWTGERRNMVSNGGYDIDKTINETSLKYTSGINLSSHYALSKTNGIKIAYATDTYETNSNGEGNADSVSVAYNHSF